MPVLTPKTYLRSYYLKILKRKTIAITPLELSENAVVFAPHQDDETLGCGATLIKKKEAGAEVRVVFMTDGRQSHANFLSPEELTAIRHREALDACQSLGINTQDVHFLDYEDGILAESVESAVPIVTAILKEYLPGSIFIPYHQDVLADHIATNQIVCSAIHAWGQRVTVYEFPVWFWFHWPWVRILQDDRILTRMVLKKTIQFQAGLQLLRDFKISVDVKPELKKKKTALSLYPSQMVRLNSDPRWPILSDVSNGEFLACFFQGLEVFHSYEIGPVP
jgi:LmbE family N-acetylglucosaminyl deacetylase